jgi:hypothetical protein
VDIELIQFEEYSIDLSSIEVLGFVTRSISGRAAAGVTPQLDMPLAAPVIPPFRFASVEQGARTNKFGASYIHRQRSKYACVQPLFHMMGRPLPQRIPHHKKLPLSRAPAPTVHFMSHARC